MALAHGVPSAAGAVWSPLGMLMRGTSSEPSLDQSQEAAGRWSQPPCFHLEGRKAPCCLGPALRR